MSKILEELRTIGTIDLACKATNILEKALWVAVLMSGTVWAVYFISLCFIQLQEDHTIVLKGSMKLNELNYPAITVCSEVSPKYAIAEQLGNFFDTEKLLPEELADIFSDLLKVLGEDHFLNRKIQTPSKYVKEYGYKCYDNPQARPLCKVNNQCLRLPPYSSHWFHIIPRQCIKNI